MLSFRHITLFCCAITCESLYYSQQRSFAIGGWNSAGKADFIKKFSPALQTYLTAEVGKLYDPPITFTLVPLNYEPENNYHKMIKEGKLDFAYHLGGGLICLESEYGYARIATQVSATLSYDLSCFGCTLATLKSNKDIKDVSDFRNKRVGVGYPWSLSSFLLGSQLLDKLGLNIYAEFSQAVIYLANYDRIYKDLMAGKIDVAVIQSGWVEARYPDTIPQLIFHQVVPNMTYHSEVYPFPTSSKLSASYGIAAAPHIPQQLRQQISEALRKLNRTQAPAKAAGIANFIPPASYEDSRDLLERLGMIVPTADGGKECMNVEEGVEKIISCPDGFILRGHQDIMDSCALAGIPCPANMTCFCKPCIPNPVANFFPWQVVLGLCAALFAVGAFFRLVM